MLIDREPLYFIYESEYYWTDNSSSWVFFGVVNNGLVYHAGRATVSDGSHLNNMSCFTKRLPGDKLQIVSCDTLKKLLITRGIDTKLLTKLKVKAGIKR